MHFVKQSIFAGGEDRNFLSRQINNNNQYPLETLGEAASDPVTLKYYNHQKLSDISKRNNAVVSDYVINHNHSAEKLRTVSIESKSTGQEEGSRSGTVTAQKLYRGYLSVKNKPCTVTADTTVTSLKLQDSKKSTTVLPKNIHIRKSSGIVIVTSDKDIPSNSAYINYSKKRTDLRSNIIPNQFLGKNRDQDSFATRLKKEKSKKTGNSKDNCDSASLNKRETITKAKTSNDKALCSTRFLKSSETTAALSVYCKLISGSKINQNQFRNRAISRTGIELDKKALFAKTTTPTTSKWRFSYLKHRGVSASRSHYQSAFDLRSQSSLSRETENNSLSNGYRSSRNVAYSPCEFIGQVNSDKSYKSAEEQVALEKKRLCKSLSNLTAEDVLSIPCSSIYNSKTSYGSRILRINESSNNNNFINEKNCFSQNSENLNQVKPHNMSRTVKLSRSRPNSANANMHCETDSVEGKKRVGLTKRGSTNGEKPIESLNGRASTSIVSEEKKNERKSNRKTAKFTKGFFPFLRKHLSKQSLPVAVEPELVLIQTNSQLDTNANNSKLLETDYAKDRVNEAEMQATEQKEITSDVGGFKKLVISNSPTQTEVHSAYASRFNEMRNEKIRKPKTGSLENSPTFTTNRDSTRDHGFLKNLLTKDVKLRLRNKLTSRQMVSRHSVDLTSENKALTKSCPARRPVSLAMLNKDYSCRNSDVIKSTFTLNCFSSTDNIDKDEFEPFEETTPRSGCLSDENSKKFLSSYKKPDEQAKVYERSFEVKSSFESEDPLSEKCSSDLAAMETVPSKFIMTPDETLTDNETAIGNLSYRSSRSSAPIPNSLLPTARLSLTSSFGSVSGEESHAEKEDRIKEVHPVSSTFQQNTKLVQRSKSLCRHNTVPNGMYEDSNERRHSVSPYFCENRFKSISAQPNMVSKMPPSLPCSRHSSLREVPSYSRPLKPTTPKPKKISSASSFGSLQKFNFSTEEANGNQVSIQNIQDVTIRSYDGRKKSSKKNAQIRRRMSLQLIQKSRISDGYDVTRGLQEFDYIKRNSLTALDLEKVKLAMAKWSSTSSSGNNGAVNRRVRRRTRPLSEVQNLRWEVLAIPEHKELSASSNSQNPTPALEQPVLTTKPSSLKFNQKDCMNELKDLLVTSCAKKQVLWTCLSEEDLLCFPRDEEFGQTVTFPRSLSLEDVFLEDSPKNFNFIRKKNFWESPRVNHFLNQATTSPVSLFCYNLHERNRRQGSTVSGISNESGYGSMSRKRGHLRPNDVDDEEVFHVHSNRLSNSDFPTEDGLYVQALWDHVTMDEDELGFKVGDVIRVIDMSNADWWWGELFSKQGWFPATFVRVLVNQHQECVGQDDCAPEKEEVDEYSRVTDFGAEEPLGHGGNYGNSSVDNISGLPKKSSKHPEIVITTPAPSRKASITRDQVRKNVINEIINSEKGFVSHLKDVIEGYLSRCRRRTDMFSEEQISILFSNIEEIYQFQKRFASELEAALNHSSVHSTELGKVFLSNKVGFTIYSKYCNNHPQAIALLSQLYPVKKYMQFFEACRLLQKMIDISLDGFLLTPVQKICKYPLQLAELLKYTSTDHPDYEPVRSALVAMKDVANMINERKRMLENVRKISVWQSSVLNWQGEDVLARSRELVHSGEVYVMKQSKGKSKARVIFVFDHQLVICKKDLLRKDLLCYKSRLDLDRHVMIPMEGYSPRSSTHMSGEWSSSGSGSSQSGWILTDKTTAESTIMLCKNEEDFEKWMKVFPQEREIALSQSEYKTDIREEFSEDLLKTTLVVPRKPKDTLAGRSSTYRQRMKMAQEANFSKQKMVQSASLEKGSAGFFSNVAGKLTPFRRATTKEGAVVY